MPAAERNSSLPIDALLPQIIHHLQHQPNLVLQAEPGAGKTTRVPPALLGIVLGEVLVLEPRRIAARTAARRVAYERNEQPGETVGYQVRFEDVSSPRTRLRFVTEGVLVRRMLSDPQLNGIDAVLLDEFHERHLDTDLALALLHRLQQTAKPTLKLIVMSATLQAAPVAAFLGNCPVVTAHGRTFPLTIQHAPYSPLALQTQVANAVTQLLRENHNGHILAFLPGAAEIRRAQRECESIARAAGYLTLPLYGDQSPAEQDRAIAPSAQPKLILATNVAESSVTIDGVTAVIDSGLARIAATSPWSGLPTLTVQRISQASATQRAGRAGRTAPGRVLRLYSEQDYRQRPDHDIPELLRADLSSLVLQLQAMNVDPQQLSWLDAPPTQALEAAEQLLASLGKQHTAAMARLPLPPRLARVLVEAQQRTCIAEACIAAAILSTTAQASDLLEAIDIQNGTSAAGMPDARTAQTATQLRRILRVPNKTQHASDDALLQSILAGYPDRVARRRTGNTLLLANGSSADFATTPPPYEFLVALDAEDRSDKPNPLVRTTARIEPDWLIDLFPNSIREETILSWNRSAERVEAVTELRYQSLLLQEWRDARPDPAQASSLLAGKALEAGIDRFIDAEALNNLQARIAFAGLQPINMETAFKALCEGLTTFTQLRRAGESFIPNLEAQYEVNKLRELAPPTLKLKQGRTVKVLYQPGKPPSIASRLQDFFTMPEGPRIGPHRTPVLMELLGPNNRPLQTTQDLSGFWQRLYPELRRSLMRRYPRHQWPENPLSPHPDQREGRAKQ